MWAVSAAEPLGTRRTSRRFKDALGHPDSSRHEVLSRPAIHSLALHSAIDMSSLLCAICLDTLEAKRALSTTCGHIFCSECATSHFTIRPSCPICRTVQTPEQLIRLFPEYGTASQDASIASAATSSLRGPQSQSVSLRRLLNPGPQIPQLSRGSQPLHNESVSSLRIRLDSTNTRFPWLRAGVVPACDLDGSPVFLGVAAFRNGMHPCKIGIDATGRPRTLVSYGGQEYKHHGTTYLLPFDPATMLWVRASYGRFPLGCRPVEGGYERIGAQKLYHALAVIDGVSVPGKIGDNGHMCGANVPFDGREHVIVPAYEVLCWRN